MRGIGATNTEGADVRWIEATAENTGLPDHAFALVAFGSSFNVTDRQSALRESARLLRPRGWFACMWNHRDLDDPVQAEVEAIIRSHVRDYALGTRREDQTAEIGRSRLFGPVLVIEAPFRWILPKDDFVAAWRSHATLKRQAGSAFPAVIADIEAALASRDTLEVPYVTRLWCAEVKA